MKLKRMPIPVGATMALLPLVCGLSVCTSCSAAEEGTYPMQVSVTIPSGNEYIAGQAIILHYKMVNVTGNHLVMTPPDADSDQWYSLTVTDAGGNTVKPLPERLPLIKHGVFSPPTSLFYSSSVREGDIVVNRDYNITAPGTYKVKVQTHLAYVDLGVGGQLPLDQDYTLKYGGNTLTQDTVFSVDIRPPGTDQLNRLAHVLRQQFDASADSVDSAEKERLLESLFALPAEAAAPTWRVLALDALPVDRPAIAKALADNRSLKAIDILIQMYLAADADHPDTSAESPILLVKRIYEVSSAETKVQIDKLLVRHRTNLNVPDILD